MSKRITYDSKMIGDFCRLTGDNNRIHDEDFMHSLKPSKQTIVPGLMVLSGFGSIVEPADFPSVNYWNVNFGGFFNEGDEADLSIRNDEDDGLLIADNISSGGNDVFYSVGGKSFRGDVTRYRDPIEEAEANVPIDFQEIDDFGKLMGIGNRGLRNSLFSLSLASRVLLGRIENPTNDVEKELSKLYYKDEKRSVPVYRNFSVYFPSEDKKTSIMPGEDLSFYIESEKIDRKNYSIKVDCFQDDFPIYQADFNLGVMREDVLIRGAKESTVEDD